MEKVEYDAYPVHNCNLSLDVFDRAVYRQRLADDAGRLFSASEIDIDVAIRDGKTRTVSNLHIESESSLESLLESLAHDGLEVFLSFHSWDYLLVNITGMKKLLAHFDVFPRFLDLLHSFGLRKDSIGEDLPMISHQRESPRNGRLEFCFDVRYPEENGRRFGDPWSIRHTALYYQYDKPRDISMTLLVQPSSKLQTQIYSLLTSETNSNGRSILIQHAVFVSSGISWKYYIVYMERELSMLEEKAYFSKVGVTAQYNHPLVFRDYQRLQRLVKKMLKTRAFLAASLDVSNKYQSTGFAKYDLSTGALDWYTTQLDTCQREVCRLLKNADAVGEALHYILRYRNEEATLVTTNGIHENGRLLTKLATLSNQSADGISKLTLKAAADSRATKVLTLVAALYLPATLVASVFNSNLVESMPTQGRFSVAREFWMFPVFTLALMVLTLSPVWLWVRRPHSKHWKEEQEVTV